jgi:acyl-CoA synthetase (AMP-forming)/AMP-acid ligase II
VNLAGSVPARVIEPDPHNLSLALKARALEAPRRIAMHYPSGRSRDGRVGYAALSYGELEATVTRLAAALARIGIGPGVRAAVMVKPGPEFFALIYALLRSGAVPVLIDPGIARGALKACLAEAAPAAFIGIPLAHVARIALGWGRGSIRTLVTVGRRFGWGGYRYRDLLDGTFAVAAANAKGEQVAAEAAPAAAQDLAAILFTSGATGVPKGVEYQHRHFAAQVELIRAAFGIEAGQVNLPTFPPFALFDPALGLTSVLPAMDFRRPARADPVHLVEIAARFGVSMLFGSPAVMEVLARHGEQTGAKLAGVARVLSAGAPVRPDVVARLQRMLPEGAQIWTPYGATECLPVAIVEGRELVSRAGTLTESGAGICVGRPLAANTVRIIRISDEAIPAWSDDLLVAQGQVGEITVAGPSATESYFRRDAATALAKIVEAQTADEATTDSATRRSGRRIVHRMGDLGYFDPDGRLWYVGRKLHRVETAAGALYPEQVEGIFNAHPGVKRTALVGIGAPGRQLPALCVELAAAGARAGWARIETELKRLGARHELTRAIAHFARHPAFPVDIRHNAKIDRVALARWMERKIS